MSDIILIRPFDDSVPYYLWGLPYSLLYVAAPLITNGYSVRIIDQVFEQNWKIILLNELRKNPICVGITNITGRQVKYSIDISKFIKKYSNVPIIFGGVNPTLFPKETLKHPNVDFIVKGEGEITFLKLVKSLENNKPLNHIRGLGYKFNGNLKINLDRDFIDLNTLPELPFNLLNVNNYILKKNLFFKERERALELPTSRGCSFDCSFCYNQKFFKNTWRALSPEKIIEQISFLKEKFKIDSLIFVDDNFFFNKKRVEKLNQLLIKEKLDINYFAKCRADTFSSYNALDIESLKKGGCSALQFGFESGSQKILNLINKGISIQNIIHVNKKLQKHKLFCKFGFVCGLPYETIHDTMKTLNLIKYLKNKNPFIKSIVLSIFTPYPGTRLFDLAIKLGLKVPRNLEDIGNYDWNNAQRPWLTKNYLNFLKKCRFILEGMFREDFFEGWFNLRFNIITSFSIVGPVPERNLFNLFGKRNLKSQSQK